MAVTLAAPPVRWWPMAACGVIAGTIGHTAIGIAFRLVTMLVIQATAGPGPESAARYATWPLFVGYLGYSFSPKELAYGAVAGVAIAAVLRTVQEINLSVRLLCGLVFAAVMLLKAIWQPQQPLSLALGFCGDVVRGSVLAWLAEFLYNRWAVQ
jgi:hypothetical protein